MGWDMSLCPDGCEFESHLKLGFCPVCSYYFQIKINPIGLDLVENGVLGHGEGFVAWRSEVHICGGLKLSPSIDATTPAM